MHDIKSFKPSKKSRYQQGYIDPSKCKKLFESQKNKPIIFRSSYERKFIWWLETSPKVKRWASESVSIPYYSPLDKKEHHYWPDYIVTMDNDETLLIEVKPYAQTQPPNGFLYGPGDRVYDDYVRNQAKWKAANSFCKQHGMKFQVVTERTISKL